MTEEQLQAKCFLWFWNNYPHERRMVFHVNNNSANAIQGNNKRSQGVTKGVSDFIMILNGIVVFVEMKLPTGTQSREQKDFQNKVQTKKHPYMIWYGFEEFKTKIREFYGKDLGVE